MWQEEELEKALAGGGGSSSSAPPSHLAAEVTTLQQRLAEALARATEAEREASDQVHTAPAFHSALLFCGFFVLTVLALLQVREVKAELDQARTELEASREELAQARAERGAADQVSVIPSFEFSLCLDAS